MPTPAVSICTPCLCASAEELSNWLLSAALPAREMRSRGLFFSACLARMLPRTECTATVGLFPSAAHRDSSTRQDLQREMPFEIPPQLFLQWRRSGTWELLFSHLLGDLRLDHASDAQRIDFYSNVKLEDSLKALRILEVVLSENPMAR